MASTGFGAACRLAAVAWLWVIGTGVAEAVTLPIEYSGIYRVTVTVQNEFGSNQCSQEAGLSIRLTADGEVNYEGKELETYIQTPARQPPTCEVRPSGATTTLAGTHDGKGRFVVPVGVQGLPDLTGDFDDESIRAEYRWGSLYFSFELPAISHRIAIEPDPSQGFAFHTDILEGKGFKLVVRDPHGRDHIDWSTFQMRVGGTAAQPGPDMAPFLISRLAQGIVPFREESPDSRTKVFRLLPDPSKLQQGHDVFAIPYNGDWRIQLRVCDVAATCFETVYTVYFGPFVSTLAAADKRCATQQPAPLLDLLAIVGGNIGIDSPHSSIYVALARQGDAELWTFFFDDMGDGSGRFAWWEDRLEPFVPQVEIRSGLLVRQQSQQFPVDAAVLAGVGAPFTRRTSFPDGDYRLITAVLDRDTGAFRRVERNVTMCRP